MIPVCVYVVVVVVVVDNTEVCSCFLNYPLALDSLYFRIFI